MSHEDDWKQASPARIDTALQHALGKGAGGWFVLDASSRVGHALQRFEVAGRELVAWRGPSGLLVAPAACPHMGADLSCGSTRDGKVVCPWHGLALGEERHGAWAPLRTHEDGILSWVQIPGIEPLTDVPVHPSRPTHHIAGVIRTDVRCEPQDILANRLDPWHGVHFHPHSFARLRVLEESPESILLRVSYRIAGRVAMEVDATFDCPSRRVIVMTIVRGEGEGSLVETHATPIDDKRCAVIEAASDDLPPRARVGGGAVVEPEIVETFAEEDEIDEGEAADGGTWIGDAAEFISDARAVIETDERAGAAWGSLLGVLRDLSAQKGDA